MPLFEEALRIIREVGYVRNEAYVVGYLATVHADRGGVEEARSLYRQSIALARGAGDRFSESSRLQLLARLQRRTGELDDAEQLLFEAISIMQAIGNRIGLVYFLCERGSLEMARNRTARTFLEEAQQIVEKLDPQAARSSMKDVSDLQRVIEAFEQGRPLFRGELVEDLPAGLRRWLIETGQLDKASD